jgi:hypothetical protein
LRGETGEQPGVKQGGAYLFISLFVCLLYVVLLTYSSDYVQGYTFVVTEKRTNYDVDCALLGYTLKMVAASRSETAVTRTTLTM